MYPLHTNGYKNLSDLSDCIPLKRKIQYLNHFFVLRFKKNIRAIFLLLIQIVKIY